MKNLETITFNKWLPYLLLPIKGKKPITEAKPLPVTTTPRPAVPEVTAPAAAVPTKGTPGFEVVAAIGAMGAIYILYRKRR